MPRHAYRSIDRWANNAIPYHARARRYIYRPTVCGVKYRDAVPRMEILVGIYRAIGHVEGTRAPLPAGRGLWPAWQDRHDVHGGHQDGGLDPRGDMLDPISRGYTLGI